MTMTTGSTTLVSPMSAELDRMFAAIDEMGTPEGYRWQIVEGQVVMSPQRAMDSHVILLLIDSLEDQFGRRTLRLLSDVRTDLPGYLHGFAPDVMLVTEGAQPVLGEYAQEHYRYEDVLIAAEVVSKSTQRDDYGVKLAAYAAANIPVYAIADPIKGIVSVLSEPEGGEYQMTSTYRFGEMVTLPLSQGIVVDTSDWPRY